MLNVNDLVVRFGDTTAVDGATLEVADQTIHVLMGPSGSGKSTMLRAISGLEPVTSGDIMWDGRSTVDIPTHKRGFGLMFQDYALFPHRTVAGNVAFGLQMQGLDSDTTRSRVAAILELVGLPGYEDRRVGSLSGGERQRVALARTLAPHPRLVLLDEPLGALDRSLREHLLIEMRTIFSTVGVTVLYVTHDREEAFTIADEVAIIREGRIVADDTPEGLWHHPPDGWTARFIGLENLLPSSILAGLGLECPTPTATTGVVPPEAILLRPSGAASAPVAGSHFRGGAYRIELDLGAGSELVAWSGERLEAGARAQFDIDTDRVSWFED
ncbi:MAG: ABC transporter ATP-binding protein [Acidimicrobiia bacterium]